MAIFDPERFAKTVLENAEGVLNKVPNAEEAGSHLGALELDIEATLAALEMSNDSRRSTILKQEMASYLASRTDAIREAISKNASMGTRVSLSIALDFAAGACRAVADSFVACGNL